MFAPAAPLTGQIFSAQPPGGTSGCDDDVDDWWWAPHSYELAKIKEPLRRTVISFAPLTSDAGKQTKLCFIGIFKRLENRFLGFRSVPSVLFPVQDSS